MSYARVFRLPQYFRNIQRLSEIARVLVKHGFGDLLNRLNISSYLESGIRRIYPSYPESNSDLSFDVRLRMAFEELGPTFIKFGQIMAGRPDIFPVKLCQELKRLQDRVPAFSLKEAKALIEAELKKPLDQVFESFSDIPLAAASIAQVHRARLLTGEEVIVKVQRPNLEKLLSSDIEILRGFAALIEENLPETENYSLPELVEEFSRALKKECDFLREAQNMLHFAEDFSDEPDLIVPKVFHRFTTRLVLTEQYIDGFKAYEVEDIKAAGIDRRKVVETLNRVVLRSIFQRGYFHADPHPGNILILRDSKVALLDFGMMGRLDKTRIDQVLNFLVALLSKDLDRMLRILHETKIAPMLTEEVALKSQISEIIDHYLRRSLENLDLAGLLTEIFEVVKRYGVRPPPDLLLIAKSITTLISIGSELDPDFVPVESIKPYLLERYLAHLTDPRLYAAYISDVADAYRRLFTDFPNELRQIMRNLARGELSLLWQNKDFEKAATHQNHLLNRALFGFSGLSLLSLGICLLGFSSLNKLSATAAYLLVGAGAALLFLTWLAVRRSDGM